MIRLRVIAGLLSALAGLQQAHAIDEDLYGEQGTPEYRRLPGTEWREQALELPAYPVAGDLLEFDPQLSDFLYTLLIDSNSLSVGEDYVIRYTVVLRSPSGAENVFYEGIRCTDKQYRRYAYGSAGQWHPLGNSQWRFVREGRREDQYRIALIKNLYCPLPVSDARDEILRKLKNYKVRRFFQYDE